MARAVAYRPRSGGERKRMPSLSLGLAMAGLGEPVLVVGPASQEQGGPWGKDDRRWLSGAGLYSSRADV